MEIRCENPDQKAASTSLARYRDRRSPSQVCNEAISEIGAEKYSAEGASYSKRQALYLSKYEFSPSNSFLFGRAPCAIDVPARCDGVFWLVAS
jgi:hypothetical protein